MTGKSNSPMENSNLSFKITLEVSRGSGGYQMGQNGPGPFEWATGSSASLGQSRYRLSKTFLINIIVVSVKI